MVTKPKTVSPSEKDCRLLLDAKKGKVVNPFTGRKVTVGKRAYSEAVKKCASKKPSKKEKAPKKGPTDKKKKKTTKQQKPSTKSADPGKKKSTDSTKGKTKKVTTTAKPKPSSSGSQKPVKKPSVSETNYEKVALRMFPADLLYIIHLLRKHKNMCSFTFFAAGEIKKREVPITDPQMTAYGGIMFIIDDKPNLVARLLEFPLIFSIDVFLERIQMCIECDRRFVVLPISIYYQSTQVPDVAHANMLFFDLKRMEMERFEPHGERTGWKGKGPTSNFMQRTSDDIDKALEEWCKMLSKRLKKTVKYFPPSLVCPNIGFQSKEGDQLAAYRGVQSLFDSGSCATWARWYADLRMKHAETKSREEVTKEAYAAIRSNPQGFIKFIEEENVRQTDIIRDIQKQLKFAGGIDTPGYDVDQVAMLFEELAGVIFMDSKNPKCKEGKWFPK